MQLWKSVLLNTEARDGKPATLSKKAEQYQQDSAAKNKRRFKNISRLSELEAQA